MCRSFLTQPEMILSAVFTAKGLLESPGQRSKCALPAEQLQKTILYKSGMYVIIYKAKYTKKGLKPPGRKAKGGS